MMTEYIIKPSKIINTVNIISSVDLGLMFMPTEVVAATAQKMDHQYCAMTGWLAYPGCGTQLSVLVKKALTGIA